MLPVLRKVQLDRRDPWNHWMGRFFDDVAPSEVFNHARIGSIDVYEDDTHLHVEAELPGFQQNQIDLTLEEGLLYLQAERETRDESEKDNYHLRERTFGKWNRAIRLPAAVQEDKIQAVYKDGLLSISMEKQNQQQVRKINIT